MPPPEGSDGGGRGRGEGFGFLGCRLHDLGLHFHACSLGPSIVGGHGLDGI